MKINKLSPWYRKHTPVSNHWAILYGAMCVSVNSIHWHLPQIGHD